MRNSVAIYQTFIRFEEEAAAIYFTMASHFTNQNPQLGELWLDLGMQEKQHAGLLQFCLLEKLFADDEPTEAQIRTIADSFSELSVRAKAPDLSVRDAFAIAMDMELSEVNDIFCRLTASLHGCSYLLKRKIMTLTPDHVERLLLESQKQGVADVTLQTLRSAALKCLEV